VKKYDYSTGRKESRVHEPPTALILPNALALARKLRI